MYRNIIMSDNTAPTLSNTSNGNQQTENSAPPQDTTAPTLTTVSIASNNSTKTNYAGENDVVTLTLVADETLSTVNVTFKSGGQEVTNSTTYSGSGTSWTAQYTVSPNDTNGIVSFAITIEDSASNSTINFDSSTTTDSSSVTKVETLNITNTSTSTKAQLQRIDGTTNAKLGGCVTCNQDGTILAAGPAKGGNKTVVIYEYNSGTNDWESTTSVTGSTDDFGYHISFDEAGRYLIITDPYSGNGNIHVYEYTTASNSLAHIKTITEPAFEVSIANEGDRFVAGIASYNNYDGQVKMYDVAGNNTNAVYTFNNRISNEIFGMSVSINKSNNGTLVVGATRANNNGNVYIYKSNGTTWNTNPIKTLSSPGHTYFGYSVAVSYEANAIIVGSNDYMNESGEINIYHYNSSNNTWNTTPTLSSHDEGNLQGANNQYGVSVAINGNGTIAAVGARGWNQIGKVYVYTYDSSTGSWGPTTGFGQNDNEFDGNGASNAFFGSYNPGSIALNRPGNYLFAGAFGYSSNKGAVYINSISADNITTSTDVFAIPPDVTSLTIASSSISQSGANIGDEITLSFEYDLAVNTPMVSFQSNGVNVADTSIDIVGTNNTIWTAKYTVNASDQEGTVTFSIDASAIDTQGVKTNTESDITNGSSITIDNTAPIISSTSINSNNTELTVTFSEDVFTNSDGTSDLTPSDFSVGITGGTAVVSNIDNVTKSNSQYVLNLTYSVLASGAETITVTPSIYDIGGNAMSTTQANNTATLNQTRLAHSSASISSNNTLNSSFASYYTNDVVTLTIVSEENISAATISVKSGGVSVNNSVSITSSGNTHTAQYVVSSSDTTGIITFTVDLLGLQIIGTTDRSRVEVVGISNILSSTSIESTEGLLLGSKIVGSALTDNSYMGQSVKMNDNGDMIVVGEHGYNSFKGRVRVYQYTNSQWNQIGNDIEGYYDSDMMGWAVDMNGDGTRIVMGASQMDSGTRIEAGVVQTYEYVNGSWDQYGGSIGGETAYYDFGINVSMNSDGTIIACAQNNGKIRVYYWGGEGTNWTELRNQDVGSHADGEGRDDNMSLSSDGYVLATGARYDDDNGGDQGSVRVWKYSTPGQTGGLWTVKGSILIGPGMPEGEALAYFGYSVKISGDGTKVIAGGYNSDMNGKDSGLVRVYEYNDEDEEWNQIGNDIFGPSNSHLGTSVSISRDGSTIATSYVDDQDDAAVRVYQYINSDWVQYGNDIVINSTHSGISSISLNALGTRLTIGAMRDDANGDDDSGSVSVYETGITGIEIVEIEQPSIFISNVSISSNNATSSSVATSDGNNEITLSITALYDITQPTVTFQTGGVDISGNVTVSVSGKDYTASFIADRVDNLGDVTFSITNYEHNSVAGGEIINTTDGSKVKLVGKRFAETTRASVANTQLGGDFIGIDNEDEKLGKGVAINGDGSIIVMSSPGNDEVNSSQGKVDVFEYNYVDASWNLMGSSIRPIHFGIPDTWSFGNYRSSISLDENGTTLAMFAESTSDTSVYIVIVKYDGTDWTQLGSTITLSKTIGENMNLKLNSFGHHLIVGLESNNSAYVYRYNGYYWFQLGSTITSENTYSELQFGYSVAINSTGNRILVGSNPSGSYTSNYSNIIYEYRASQWVKAHEFSLKNQGADNGWGCSVDMSSDGNTISIGGAYSPDSWPNYSTDPSTGDPIYSTGVIILQYDGSSWNQLGNKITSTNDSSWGFGNTHSLSKDGTVILVGEPDAEDESSNSNVGRSYVYQYDGSSTWNQVGTTYIGKGHVQSDNVQLAKYLGLSADGTTMMVGASGYDITGSTSDDHGLVQVFETGCGNRTIFDKIDNIIPEFNTLTLSSSQTTYSQYAGTGNTITLSMVTDVSVNSPTVSFTTGGNDISGNITITGSETTWTASFVVDASDTLGVVGFSAQVTSLDNIEGLITNTTTNNTGVTIVGSVLVGDGYVRAIPPTITSLTIASDLGINNYAIETSIVTLSIIADVSMNEPTVTFTSGGDDVTGAVTYTGSDTSWTAQYTVNSNDTLGTVGFTVVPQSVALLGNTNGNQVISTTDNSEITIVSTDSLPPPTLNSITISSNYSENTSYAAETYIVTITMVANENINQPTVTFTSGGDEVAGATTYSGTNTSWTAQYTVDSGDTLGVVGFTIDFSSVLTGKSGNQAISITSGNNVTIVELSPAVYDNNFTQMGNIIIGNVNSHSGNSLALNGNGNILAIGAKDDDEGGLDAGRIGIYSYNESTDVWDRLGDFIYGESTHDHAGAEYKGVSLNEKGDVIAIAAPEDDGNGNNSGHVRIYQYSKSDMTTGGDWNKIGNNYPGDGSDAEQVGQTAIALNRYGTRFVAGGPGHDGAGNGAGRIRVYETGYTYTSGSTTVTSTANLQIGQDILGRYITDYFGSECAINADGTIIAGCAKSNVFGTEDAGETRIWKYNGTQWQQLGGNIYGSKDDTDGERVSCALSDDGYTIVIGLPFNDERGGNSGRAKVYKYSTPGSFGGQWDPKGSSLVAAQSNQMMGYCVSISADGNTVASGAYQYGNGVLFVYEWDGNDYNVVSTPAGNPSITNPSSSGGTTFKHACPLNSSGTIVAFSSTSGNVPGVGNNAGETFVYARGLASEPAPIIPSSIVSSGNYTTSPTYVSSQNVTSLTLNTSNINSSLAITNDIITINLKTQEAIYTPEVQLKSGGIDLSGNVEIIGSNNDWVANYIVEEEATNGAFTFVIDVSGTEYADNQFTQANITSGSSVSIVTSPIPRISGVSVSNNNNARITFSEDVYTSSAGAGDLQVTDFELTILTGYATLSSSTPLAITKNSGTEYDLSFSAVVGDGHSDILVGVANDSSIFNLNGLPLDAGYASNNIDVLGDNFIYNLSLSSNSIYNSKYAQPGDIVNLDIKALKPILQPTVVFKSDNESVNNSVVYTGSDVSWNASYTVHTNDTSGNVTFTINYTDLESNSGIESSSTTDNTSVTIVPDIFQVPPALVGLTHTYTQSANNSSQGKNYVSTGDSYVIYAEFRETLGSLPVIDISIGGNSIAQSGYIMDTLTQYTNPVAEQYNGSNDKQYRWNFDIEQYMGDGDITYTIDVSYSYITATHTNDEITDSSVFTSVRNGPIYESVVDVGLNGLRVTFNKDVFTESDGTGDLVINTFAFEQYGNSGTLYLNSLYPSSVTKVTNSVYDLSYDLVGELENNTSAFLVAVYKRTAALIYDASGLLFSSPYKGTTFLYDSTVVNLTSVSIASDNSSKTMFASYYTNDTVTLSFTSSESLYGTPVVGITAGGADISGNVTVSGSGTTWTASYLVDQVDTLGLVGFTIDFTDGYNNKQVTATTDNSKVTTVGISTTSVQTLPAIPPVISSLGILSNNTLSTSHATDGNKITVSMTYDENLTQSPTVTFQSGGFDVALSTTISGSNATYTAEYIVDPNDTQGDVTFVIDASGTLADTNDTQLEITDGSSMEMLDSPPTFSSVTNEINKNISIEFSTDVYNTNTASGDLETSDFVLAVESGDVTLTSTTPSAISKISNKIYDLSFSLTETVTTNVPIVSINPVDSTSIYNSVGFAMIAPQTTDNSFNLIDRLPPSLTSVSISSNNTFKTKYASYFAPDTVTLTLTASENINQPVVTFAVDDVPVTDTINYSGSGAAWTVSFVVTSSTPLGNLSFSIDYTDTTDGNAGTTITSTTDATNMLILEAVVTGVNQGYVLYPPDATAVTVDSNGAHGTSVGVGETVSINIDFDNVVYDLSNISILIDDVSINNPFTITPEPPAKSFTISFVISESDPSGNITFSMDASGALGVTTVTHNLITDGSSMETDFTLPVFAGSLSTSTQLNHFDPTYLQGFLDISGAGIRMQNDSKLFIGGDVSLAGNMFIDSTNSVKINTTENNAGYSLDVSGNTDLSGNVSIAGDIDVSGNVVGMVNYNTINKDIPPISNSAIDYSDSTDETALPVGIKVMTSDNSFNSTTATIHNDLSANGNFGSTFIFDNSLSVAGSVLVSDLSQNSYGAYTIYSKKDSTDSFMVGKSASNVFTIVNQSNVGVFMNSDSNVLTSTSDKNLKTNISNLENNSENIMKLRPVEFNWNYEDDNKKKHVGFIAQEVEEIFPELVEENVYPNGEVYKGVNTNKLIPYMIDEIKLLEEKLEKLEKIK